MRTLWRFALTLFVAASAGFPLIAHADTTSVRIHNSSRFAAEVTVRFRNGGRESFRMNPGDNRTFHDVPCCGDVYVHFQYIEPHGSLSLCAPGRTASTFRAMTLLLIGKYKLASARGPGDCEVSLWR